MAGMRWYVAEAIGTFVLVFGGVGAAVLAGDRVGPLGVSFAFGLSLLTMVYVIGPVSGCHANPAVTAGLLLSRKIEPRNPVGYVVAQCGGAVVAAGAVLIMADSIKMVTPRARAARAWVRTATESIRPASTGSAVLSSSS